MNEISTQILIDLFVGIILLWIEHRYFLNDNDNKKKLRCTLLFQGVKRRKNNYCTVYATRT